MYTVHAVDPEGENHGECECATLEAAIESLHEMMYHVGVFCGWDDARAMRYGILIASDIEMEAAPAAQAAKGERPEITSRTASGSET